MNWPWSIPCARRRRCGPTSRIPRPERDRRTPVANPGGAPADPWRGRRRESRRRFSDRWIRRRTLKPVFPPVAFGMVIEIEIKTETQANELRKLLRIVYDL